MNDIIFQPTNDELWGIISGAFVSYHLCREPGISQILTNSKV